MIVAFIVHWALYQLREGMSPNVFVFVFVLYQLREGMSLSLSQSFVQPTIPCSGPTTSLTQGRRIFIRIRAKVRKSNKIWHNLLTEFGGQGNLRKFNHIGISALHLGSAAKWNLGEVPNRHKHRKPGLWRASQKSDNLISRSNRGRSKA